MLMYQRGITILLACLLFVIVYEISNSRTSNAKLEEACRQVIYHHQEQTTGVDGSVGNNNNNNDNQKAVVQQQLRSGSSSSSDKNDEEREVEQLNVIIEEEQEEDSSSSSASATNVYDMSGVYQEKLNPPNTCVIDYSKMPDSWKQPPKHWAIKDTGEPWTIEEQNLLNDSALNGLMELVNFYNTISEKRIKNLYTNAANSIIDQCFSSSNMPQFQTLACECAAKVIIIVSEDYIKYKNGCHDMHYKAKLLGYAHYVSLLLPGNKRLQQTRNELSHRMQYDLNECQNLNNYMQVKDWESDLNSLQTKRKTIRNYVHKSNVLTGLYTIPELQIPNIDELDKFTYRIWNYVAKYNFTYAKDVPDGTGFDGGDPRHHAYLVTHAAYMPTGYGRHMQYVDDAPWLYKYIRENYYAAMDGLDLFAEFIDILRQYGCTEENDIHVRHGSRYLLDMYAKAGHSWMKYRGEHEHNPSDYDLIHKPWTALAGVRRKQVEPIFPGSYGYSFRKALERAKVAEENEDAPSESM